MTDLEFTIKLGLHRMWLKTNPPMDQIARENEKLVKQITAKKNGRCNNS